MSLTEQQLAELEEARSQFSSTRRPTVPALETILQMAYPVLDHGFVRVVDYMGDDAAVVQSARVSYGRGTKKVTEDAGLINYLMRHQHSTPFEMCEIKFHVKLPIFVARQWIRHRTANVNEYSARYSILDQEFYIPEPEHLAVQSTSNRQGRGDIVSADQAIDILELLRRESTQAYDGYAELHNDDGTGKPKDPGRPMLARELARMNLSLNYYTQWYWKTDLHNLFHFLSLRTSAHAQYEIRVYADTMLEMVRQWVPLSTKAFEEYNLHAFTLSASMITAVKLMAGGTPPNEAMSSLSKRDRDELKTALELE